MAKVHPFREINVEEGLLPPLTPADWAARELDDPDHLIGEVHSTTSRSMLAADTGLGKTMMALALAVRMRLGQSFLHWKAKRAARVLYIDGEMPAELLRERIVSECQRAGISPASLSDGLYILSREDADDMPSLDTDEGVDWLLGFIKRLGKVDFIVFDNLMCLTSGDLREETTWKALKPLVLRLSKERIGQLWIHHVGHDKSRPYGSKTFQWQLDTVMLGEAVENGDDADVAFKLTFQKSRRRTPSNQADFDTVTVTLRDDRWESSAAITSQRAKPLGKRASICLDALERALAHAGEKPPHHDATRHVTHAVTITTWRQYFEQIAPYEKGSSAMREAWRTGTEDLLVLGGRAGKWGEWVWKR